MAVTFDAQTTPTIAVAGGTSFSDTNLTIGASANALIVLISSSGDLSTPTVTWNGVALTLLVQTVSTGVNGYAGIFGLLSPATGNQTLAGSWVNSQDAFISGVSFSGVNVTSLLTAFPNTGSNTGTSTTASVTTTSSVGDVVAAVQGAPFQGSTPPVPDNINIFNRVSAGGYGGSANRATGAASVTLSATLFSSRAWAASGVDIGAAPSAAAQPRAPHVTKLPSWKFAPLLQFYNQALYTPVVASLPFNSVEFAHTNVLPDWAPAPPPPLNINLFTNPIPLNQIDWSKPFRVPLTQPQPSPALNINLFTNPLPINQVDWSKSVRAPRSPFSPDQSLNINLFTNPFPFSQTGPATAWFDRATPAPDQIYNPNLYSVVVLANPFNQTDWSTGRFPRTAAFADQPLNLNLFATVIQAPFIPMDWSKPFVPRPASPLDQTLNPNLFTNPIPFNQVDWAKPFKVLPQSFSPDQSLNLNLFFIAPAPFNQIDWSKPFRVPLAPFTASPPLNLNLFTNPIPFNQIDWAKPLRSPRASVPPPDTLNPNIFTNPIPFNQVDWSRPIKVSSVALDQQPLNLNLFSFVIVSLPLNQTDWSKPFRVPLAPFTASPPLNLNLFTNPVPFMVTDRLPSFRVPLVQPQPQTGINPNLFKNPVPFNQVDWAKPLRVRGYPNHTLPQNLNLFNKIIYLASMNATERGDFFLGVLYQFNIPLRAYVDIIENDPRHRGNLGVIVPVAQSSIIASIVEPMVIPVTGGPVSTVAGARVAIIS